MLNLEDSATSGQKINYKVAMNWRRLIMKRREGKEECQVEFNLEGFREEESRGKKRH